MSYAYVLVIFLKKMTWAFQRCNHIQKMEQFCKQHDFSKHQLQKNNPSYIWSCISYTVLGYGKMFWKHSWHYCCWALIVAMLPREKACSATGIAWDAWIWPPPSAESFVFMTKACEKQQFSCIFRCGPSAKSGVQEKLKFGRLKGVLGGPEAHI